MSTAKLDVQADKSEKLMIANFTNGQIKGKNLEHMKTACFANINTDARRSKQRILVSETDRLSYVGKNFGPSSNRIQQMCRYYVGIHDKETGKIRICDAEVFNMQPQIPGQEATDYTDGFDEAEETSLAQKLDLLTGAFGSSKKQRAMETRHKLKVKGEALEQAMASAVRQAPKQDMSKYTQKDEVSTDMLPPFRKDAQTPEDVYSINDIITPMEMDAITNHAKELYDCTSALIQEWTKSERFPKYILKHLPYLPVSEDARWKKVKYLKYLHFMIELYNFKAADLKRKYPLPSEWPDSIKHQLLSNFTLQINDGRKTIRCMPARLKDKLVCYMLVLCLIIEEYNLELSDLLTDLKMGLKRLETHFRMLGCQIKTQKLSSEVGGLELRTVSLPVPLTFPKPPSPRKKKERR